MTFAQRFRRALFWALMGGALARLYVLGEAKSWRVVGPVALEITALTLAAWLAHVVWHELGHVVAASRVGFQLDAVGFGPVQWSARDRRFSWAGLSLSGRVSTLPIGASDLKRRLRIAAAGGPIATALATLTLAVWWLRSGNEITSPIGISMVAGVLVLVSAATPGRLRASTSVAGNDVDQIIGPRWVLAHWTYLAVVQGVLAGKRPLEALGDAEVDSLIPPAPESASGITLIAAIRNLERREVEKARSLLLDASMRLTDSPSWVCTDVFHQLGAIASLIDSDLPRALECLEHVRKHQTLPWYQHLLEACVAHAQGDSVMAAKRVETWLAEARAVSGGRLALGGNEWILERLGQR